MGDPPKSLRAVLSQVWRRSDFSEWNGAYRAGQGLLIRSGHNTNRRARPISHRKTCVESIADGGVRTHGLGSEINAQDRSPRTKNQLAGLQNTAKDFRQHQLNSNRSRGESENMWIRAFRFTTESIVHPPSSNRSVRADNRRSSSTKCWGQENRPAAFSSI